MGVALGVGLSDPTLPSQRLFLVAAAGLFALAWVAARRTGAHAALLAGAVALGVGLGSLCARTDIPPGLADGGAARLEAEVLQVREGDAFWQVDLAVSRAATAQGAFVPCRFRARLSTGAPARWLGGERLLLDARLKPLEGAANWGEQDRAPALARNAVAFTGSFEPGRAVLLAPAPRWRAGLHAGRLALQRDVTRLAPSAQSAALFLTLAAGLRASLGEALEETFARSGLAHVLSVSGLHVAALAFGLLAALRLLLVRSWAGARTFDVRRLAAPLSIPLLWAYVLYTGAAPPAVRSAVMTSLLLVGMALWRRSDGLNALAVAALGVLVLDPASLADLSLQLSFLAVAALILLAPALREALPLAAPEPTTSNWRHRLGRLREGTLQTLCASAAVIAASLPLIASTFHRLSLAGLLANIVALPLCGLLTGAAAGSAGLHVIHPLLARPLILAGVWGSQALVALADAFAALPFAAVEVPSFSVAATLLYAAGLGCFALGRGRARLGALAAPLAIAWAWAPGWPSRELTVTFLAVGHGDAIVVSSRGAHALIDGGGVPGGTDTGRRFVLPYLREQGVRELTLAALSHPHPDHALGLASALEALPVQRLWVPRGAGEGSLLSLVRSAAKGAAQEEVDVGHPPLQLGDAQLEVLGPPQDRALLEGVNDRSLVLRLRHGEVTFLLTGDLEEAGEEALEVGEVTVVKAPHHGSRTSSGPAFIARTRPAYVVFCVGRRNRFGFPHAEVVERYQTAGARCLRTDVNGAVRFYSDGTNVRVETFLPPEPSPLVGVVSQDADAHRDGR